MRILFLTTAHNSLSQRLSIELVERGHEVSVELALDDSLMLDAIERYRPELILAPFLKKIIPATIWGGRRCLIVHPGIKGDRGPSSLDWAIQDGSATWGVTVLQATAEPDAGDIWSARTFDMRAHPISKSGLYRGEVTEAAVEAVLEAVEKAASKDFIPEPLDYAKPDVRGRLRAPMRQHDRQIDWTREDTATIARKIRAADSSPGVLDTLCGTEYFVFGAHEEDRLKGTPGEVLAQRDGAICRATVDGALRISHLKERRHGQPSLKLPAVMAL